MTGGEPGNVRGIDGWLLLFLAGCVATSLYFLIELGFSHLLEQWRQEEFGRSLSPLIAAEDWVYNSTRVALPLVVLWRMVVARRWGTVVLAIGLIWLLFVGMHAVDAGLAVSNYGWERVSGVIGKIARRAAMGAFLAIGPTLYLLGSRRVAATYPRHVDLDQVFD